MFVLIKLIIELFIQLWFECAYLHEESLLIHSLKIKYDRFIDFKAIMII